MFSNKLAISWRLVGYSGDYLARLEIEEMPQQRHSTRMTRIGRIFTDIFNPWVSASSAQSVFYRNPAIIDDDKKPQISVLLTLSVIII
jgi:hypothetical protein